MLNVSTRSMTSTLFIIHRVRRLTLAKASQGNRINRIHPLCFTRAARPSSASPSAPASSMYVCVPANQPRAGSMQKTQRVNGFAKSVISDCKRGVM